MPFRRGVSTPTFGADGRARHQTAPISSFIGRAREAADVMTLLRDHWIVTLTGAGSSGKSRLALRVAWALARPGDDGAVAWWGRSRRAGPR